MKDKIRKIKTIVNMKMIRNLIIFIGLIILTFYMIFKDQDMNELINVIKSADILFVLLGLFTMFMYFFMEAYNIKKILKTFNNNISIFKALKYTFIGFFFSGITPAASGGQPIEIYYMTKENISGANATLTLLIQLCSFQIATISYGVICAILNFKVLRNSLIWLYLLGLIINGVALGVMLICVFSKRLTKKLVNILVKILKFFRVNNIDMKVERINKGLEQYNESSIYIKEHKNEFIKSVLRVFIQIFFYYLVPFCVYKAFGLNGYNVFSIFTMQAILYTTVSSLPLPGAIGISESVFLTIFGPVFGNKILKGAMLLNRGINFYSFIILSLLIVIINAIRMKKVKGEIDNKIVDIEKQMEEQIG